MVTTQELIHILKHPEDYDFEILKTVCDQAANLIENEDALRNVSLRKVNMGFMMSDNRTTKKEPSNDMQDAYDRVKLIKEMLSYGCCIDMNYSLIHGDIETIRNRFERIKAERGPSSMQAAPPFGLGGRVRQ